MNDPVVLVGGVRTPIGRFGGALKDVEAADLGAACVKALLSRTGVASADVDSVVMGQVGQVGLDAYNARRVALNAGLSPSSTAMNVNRLCGSGLQAIISGAQELLTGQSSVVIAGGNESMSRQPFLDYEARSGWKLGPRELVDGTLSLLTDPFGRYLMGTTAENVARRFNVSREDQDAFALLSQQRAASAIERGDFVEEIVPIENGSPDPFSRDEHPRPTDLSQLARLKPAFQEGGTVTPGNSSGINDGAGLVMLMLRSEAEKRGLNVRLVLRSWAVCGIEPEVMGYAPAFAIPRALEHVGLRLEELDVVELNEAFAAQAVAVIRAVRLKEEQVNPWGGAIAFGHPIGATGAILTVRLMHGLERAGAKLGMVAMCIGGGQGLAAVFERP
jgi:acetyl-CoA C-acetyltransferase